MATQADVAELKTQGVIEAAQDPNSKITAADAQERIVHESKKAGAVALTFDPNASPEEKAAQARAASSPDTSNGSAPKLLTSNSEFPRTSITYPSRKLFRFQQIFQMGSLAHTIFLLPRLQVHLPQQLYQKTRLASP